MIQAQVICDSLNPVGVRLTTLQLEYPRFIHQEFMTHRVFSRNAASSRAVPIEKMIERVQKNPAMPIHWGQNQRGMQADKELLDDDIKQVKSIWLAARDSAVEYAEMFSRIGLHKQAANRILEPFLHMQVVVTATEWENFFTLRAHPDAQPEIHVLAIAMLDAMNASTPRNIQGGEWHLPFITEEERKTVPIETLLKVSTARCARVSYYLHDGSTSDIEKDIALHDRLVASEPLHASPTEHQAMAMIDNEWDKNFRGWRQYRAWLEKKNAR